MSSSPRPPKWLAQHLPYAIASQQSPPPWDLQWWLLDSPSDPNSECAVQRCVVTLTVSTWPMVSTHQWSPHKNLSSWHPRPHQIAFFSGSGHFPGTLWSAFTGTLLPLWTLGAIYASLTSVSCVTFVCLTRPSLLEKTLLLAGVLLDSGCLAERRWHRSEVTRYCQCTEVFCERDPGHSEYFGSRPPARRKKCKKPTTNTPDPFPETQRTVLEFTVPLLSSLDQITENICPSHKVKSWVL